MGEGRQLSVTSWQLWAWSQTQIGLTRKPRFLPPNPLSCLCSGFLVFHINNSFSAFPSQGTGCGIAEASMCVFWNSGWKDRWKKWKNREVRGAGIGPWPLFSACTLLLPGFRLWRLVLPGRGKSVGESQGHVSHFSITRRISGAKPKVFNNIGQANLFFSTLMTEPPAARQLHLENLLYPCQAAAQASAHLFRPFLLSDTPPSSCQATLGVAVCVRD